VSLACVVGLLMARALGFAAGAFAFWVAHVLERAHWIDWFHGEYDPWFLNSGRAILVTIGAVAVASAVVAALAAAPRTATGLTVAAGAFTSMTLVLFLKPAGPGSIFPIVMVVGGVLLLVVSLAGAWTGVRLRRLFRAHD